MRSVVSPSRRPPLPRFVGVLAHHGPFTLFRSDPWLGVLEQTMGGRGDLDVFCSALRCVLETPAIPRENGSPVSGRTLHRFGRSIRLPPSVCRPSQWYPRYSPFIDPLHCRRKGVRRSLSAIQLFAVTALFVSTTIHWAVVVLHRLSGLLHDPNDTAFIAHKTSTGSLRPQCVGTATLTVNVRHRPAPTTSLCAPSGLKRNL